MPADTMSTIAAIGTALAWLFLPGYLALLVLRARVPMRLGAAPAMSALLLTAAGFIFAPFGIAWDWPVVLLSLLVLVGALWAMRLAVEKCWPPTPKDQEPRESAARLPWAAHAITAVGILAVAAIYLIPIAGSGLAITSISSAFDAVFHYNGVAYVREYGEATPWTALSNMYGGEQHFYPVVLHLFASLVAGAPVPALNATVLVALCSAGVPLASLLWLVAPATTRVRMVAISIAALLPFATLFFSIPYMALIVGLWPNALAAVAFPGIVATILSAFVHRVSGSSRDAEWFVRSIVPAVLTATGGVFIHPSLAFAIALAVFALVAAHAWSIRATRQRRALLLVGLLIATAVVYDFVAMTTLRGMALTPKIEMDPITTVLTLLADRPRITAVPLNLGYLLVVYLLAAIGIVVTLASRSRMRWSLVILAGISFIVALGTAYSFLPLSSLANPWYQARERVLPIMMTALVALAAVGLFAVVLRRQNSTRTRALILCGLIAISGLHGYFNVSSGERVPKIVALAADSSGAYLTNTVSPGEQRFIESSAQKLPRDAVVLGNPRDGAAMYWALGGADVVYPHLGRPTTRIDLLISGRAHFLEWDKEVCEAVGSHGKHVYFYEDKSGELATEISPDGAKEGSFKGLEDMPSDTLTKVAEGGDGVWVLYELSLPCR